MEPPMPYNDEINSKAGESGECTACGRVFTLKLSSCKQEMSMFLAALRQKPFMMLQIEMTRSVPLLP